MEVAISVVGAATDSRINRSATAGEDRALTQAGKIRRKLGGAEGIIWDFPEKQPRMRWRTYERLRDRCNRYEEITTPERGPSLRGDYVTQSTCEAPAHILFPQLARIVERYLREHVDALPPADRLDAFLSPYYGWIIERLVEAIKPDASQGEPPELPQYEQNREPGSTAEVDFWTSREAREVVHSHVNYVVADTHQWEQSAAYLIDTHPAIETFVKNANLGFGIPYLHNGQAHDYLPDFIIRLKSETKRYLILETKGYDELKEIKKQAAKRWVDAVNADGTFGYWQYALVERVSDVGQRIAEAASVPRSC